MITTPTVFILGAGASSLYGYPTGAELRTNIWRHGIIRYNDGILTDSPEPWRRELLDELKEFIQVFADSGLKSVDRFLALNNVFERIGKIAICLDILHAERKSQFDDQLDLATFKKRGQERGLSEDQLGTKCDWYSYLFNKFADDFLGDNSYHIAKTNISFVTFNYDRSFEHYLFRSLSNSFTAVSKQDIAAEINRLEIHHIHGKIADLEWETPSNGIEYRKIANELDIRKVTPNFRLLHNPNSEMVDKSKELIANSQRIFFLGFGFAIENLELLGFPGIFNETQFVYATTQSLTDREVRKVKRSFFQFGRQENRRLHFKDLDCRALLREYLE